MDGNDDDDDKHESETTANSFANLNALRVICLENEKRKQRI